MSPGKYVPPPSRMLDRMLDSWAVQSPQRRWRITMDAATGALAVQVQDGGYVAQRRISLEDQVNLSVYQIRDMVVRLIEELAEPIVSQHSDKLARERQLLLSVTEQRMIHLRIVMGAEFYLDSADVDALCEKLQQCKTAVQNVNNFLGAQPPRWCSNGHAVGQRGCALCEELV